MSMASMKWGGKSGWALATGSLFMISLFSATTMLSPVKADGDSESYCCTLNFKSCIAWCGTTQSECENCANDDVYWVQLQTDYCLERWAGCNEDEDFCCNGLTCKYENNYYGCVPETISPTPVATPAPTPAPTPSPVVSSVLNLLSCSDGSGISSWDALLAMEEITHVVSTSPYTLSVVSSGGAAGSGSVVSEGQGYGILAAGLALAGMTENDEHYDETKTKFEGYFNGWTQMCRNSASAAPCQSTKYCDGGTVPCLPGWKHSADFSNVEGTGSAPDGDEDAIVGMIIALKAVESDSVLPSWYDEVMDWADRSCTQFLVHETVLSDSSSHRLVKLGSCWGGWEQNGNNPSYHAPGHYRMMRDFQASVTSRSYSLPSYVNTESWNMLIDTSYKFLATTQCPDTGLVPNWALVDEVDDQTLEKYSGSFTGSGTPQYEFGSEASRTMWRIAFDAAAYPEESADQSGPFLAPLHDKLVSNFDPNASNYFGESSLDTCSFVTSVFGSWQYNAFISAPVFSTLVSGIDESAFEGISFNQQTMVDHACDRVSDTASLSYYSLSWQVIAMMTLNGDVAKAGAFFGEQSVTSAPTPTPTSSPSAIPSTAPSKSPSTSPTLSPVVSSPSTAGPTVSSDVNDSCCTWNFYNCGVDAWCNESFVNCQSVCGGTWVEKTSPSMRCISKYFECTAYNDDACCDSLICAGKDHYKQCQEESDVEMSS